MVIVTSRGHATGASLEGPMQLSPFMGGGFVSTADYALLSAATTSLAEMPTRFPVEHANVAAAVLLGIDVAQIIGSSLPVLLGDGPDEVTLGHCREVIATGEAHTDNAFVLPGTVHPRLGGERVTELRLMESSQGLLAVLKDVTEPSRLQSALARTWQLYRELTDRATDGHVILDRAGRVVYANRSAREMFGLGEDDAVPDVAGVAFDRTRQMAADRKLERGAGDGHAHSYRLEVGLPGSRRFPAEVTVASMHTGGHDARTLVHVRDLTERNTSIRDQGRLASIIEGSGDCILHFAADGRVTYASTAMASFTGIAGMDLVGESRSSVLSRFLHARAIARIEGAILRGQPWFGEVRYQPAGQPARSLEVSVVGAGDPGGELGCSVATFRDVTVLHDALLASALETSISSVLGKAVQASAAISSLDDAAQAVCAALITVPQIDIAAIEVFLGSDDVYTIAIAAPPGHPISASTQLSPGLAAVVRRRTADGPWAGLASEIFGDDATRDAAAAAGLKAFAFAFAPISDGEHANGCVAIGTLSKAFGRSLVAGLPGIASLGNTASALFASRVQGLHTQAGQWALCDAVISAGAFRPVFQPIVNMGTGDVTGFEALTRFDSGRSPDLVFSEAWSIGLGVDLELATLTTSIEAARALPAGRWLSLNVSPRLLEENRRLTPLLHSVDRPFVLEITEHEAIADYQRLKVAVGKLGGGKLRGGVRLAVDDAGAGIANFSHIVELRPDFIKLDSSLVRRVNTDLGRQGLVVGMSHFGRATGCRLVAEGIETEAEARTLQEYGVEFGQGFWFGRPEPAEYWAVARAARLRGRGGRRPGPPPS